MSALRDFLLAPRGDGTAGPPPRPPQTRPATRRALAGVLGRALVSPGAQAAAPAREAVAPTVAILCAPADAGALSAAAARLLARRHGGGCALAAFWTGEEPPTSDAIRLPGRRAAARLAGAAAARELRAGASGCLVTVRLPADTQEAAAHAARAAAVGAGVPVVVGLGGARDGSFDALLAGADLALVATRPGAPAPLREVAVSDLLAAGVPAAGVEVAPGALDRLLAPAGRGSAALRRTLAEPLRLAGARA